MATALSSSPSFVAQRGLPDDALASYEAILAERPTLTSARLRAAALYASRGGNPQRAAELLRAVMSTQDVSARDDIADRHPGTGAAARAKLTLAELKEPMARREE